MKGFLKITVWLFLVLKTGFMAGQCGAQEFAFRAGEKITFEVAYNWGFIWVDAGKAYFKTDTSKYKNQTIYNFEASGSSYPYYDWVYKVREQYQSKVDPVSFQPLWFQRKTYEGGDEVFNQYDFDPKEHRVTAQVKRTGSPMKTEIMQLDDCRLDVLSAVYYARNINYDLYNAGDKIPVKLIIDHEFYEIYIRYLGKEIIQNRSGKKYRCHKMSALLIEGTIFKGGEDLVVWVTADRNKIPIMAEAKILIGSVKVYLTGYEGLKYDVEAEIE